MERKPDQLDVQLEQERRRIRRLTNEARDRLGIPRREYPCDT